MTSRKSYSEAPISGNIFSRRLFGYTLRQSWPTTLLLFIAFFFTMSVPALISLSNPSYDYDYSVGLRGADVSTYYRNLDGFLWGAGYAICIVTMLLAALLGLISFAYENQKVSSSFWHSSPVKRECLFINEVTAKAVSFFVAFALNGALAFVIIAAKVKLRPESALIYLNYILSALLIYFVIYALVVFASVFCGTYSARPVAAVTVLFMPIGLYLAAIWPFSINSRWTQWEETLSRLAGRICLPVRIVSMGRNNLFSIVEIIGYVIVGIAALALALLVFKRRPVEKSGTPVLWKAPETVVKYFVVTMCTTGMSLIFHTIVDSWLIFGLASGAFLSFIFINALLNKSFRAMFKGMKGFAVFAVVFAIIFFTLYFDFFKLDEHIPTSYVTTQVTLYENSLLDERLVFTDKEDIDKIRDALRYTLDHRFEAYRDFDESDVIVDPEYSEYSYYDKEIADRYYQSHSNITVEIETIFGILVTKRYSLPTESFDKLAETVKETEVYSEARFGGDVYPRIKEAATHVSELQFFGFGIYDFNRDSKNVAAFLDLMSKEPPKRFDFRSCGTLSLRIDGMYRRVKIPSSEALLNSASLAVLDELVKYEVIAPADAKGDKGLMLYIKCLVDSVTVIKSGTDKEVRITDPEKIYEIMLSSSDELDQRSIFERISDDYHVILKYKEELGDAPYSYPMIEMLGFHEDSVPSFVPDLFN